MGAVGRPLVRHTHAGSLSCVIAGLLLAIGLTGHAQNPAAARESTPQSTGVIAGVVVIADSGLPLDGVRVTLAESDSRRSQRAVTDDDGRFAFTGLVPGRYTLSASKSGYVNVIFGQREAGSGRSGTPIQLVTGQAITNIRLSIPRGGVITGQVFDEKGRPSVATPVRVSQWVMATGERSLRPAGSSATDDRGMYRVYGLSPGAYIVHAVPRNPVVNQGTINAELVNALGPNTDLTGVSAVQLAADGRPVVVGVEGPEGPDAGRAAPTVGYAPVYYPGTLDLAGAQTVELGVGDERFGVDLYLQQVPLAVVSGQLLMPPGVNMSAVRVRLVNTGVTAPGIATPNTRASRDGSFAFNGVAPGQYRAVAVASARNVPASVIGPMLGGQMVADDVNRMQFWAAVDLAVFGQGVAGVTLALQPGMIVTGQVLFDGFGLPRPPDLRRVRVTLTPDGSGNESGVPSVSTNLDENGRFELMGVVPGRYRIRTSGATSGWFLESAMAGGRDALDFDLEVPERESVSNLVVTLSDRSAELSGALEDSLSRPVVEFTVILFPSDSRYWRPMSRRIASARPATDGRFVFAGLPAGEYRLAAVTDVEPGQWYDPAFLSQLVAASVPISLAEGERRVQNLRVTR